MAYPKPQRITMIDKMANIGIMKGQRNAMAQQDYMDAEDEHAGLVAKMKKKKRMMAMKNRERNALASTGDIMMDDI